MPAATSHSVAISVVVPVRDEEESLRPLHAEIAAALERLGEPWEVIYVDDGSRDGSLGVLRALVREDPRARAVQLARNCGQTAAMAAGFDHARGGIVVTLDADLQNDPADIPRLVGELRSGYDVVAGWRRRRHDGFFLRRLPSQAANRLIAWVTGVRIHDTGCTLKAFKSEVLRGLALYSDQHRFLPALVSGSGARVGEIEVNHRPRRFGRSKYGIGRATRVVLDLCSIKLISSFSQRPLQYFVMIALPFALSASVLLATFVGHVLAPQIDSSSLAAYMTMFALCSVVSVFFLMLGLLAELSVKASGMHARARALQRSGVLE